MSNQPPSDNEVSSPSKSPSNSNTLAVPQNRARGSSLDSSSSAGASSQTYVEMAASPTSKSLSDRTGTSYSEADGDPLAPREGDDETFEVENNPFAVTPGQISRLYNPKSFEVFKALGGLIGLEYALQTDIKSGLSLDEQEVKTKV